MPPLLSVIVPVFNTEKFLNECLDSIIRQTYENLEIIIVDDGSTDSSGSICELYASRDRRIKVIHQENRGLSAARNSGLNVAQGEYIAFVDSDDFLSLDCYEKSMRHMLLTKADICCYDIYENYINEVRKVPHIQDSSLKSPTFRAIDNLELLFSFWPLVWAKIYKKTFLKAYKMRFIEGILYEDNPFVLGCWIRNPMVTLLPEHLHYYRLGRPGQLSGDQNPRTIDVFKMMGFVEEDFKLNNLSSKFLLLIDWSVGNIWWLFKKTPDGKKREFSKQMLFQFIHYYRISDDWSQKLRLLREIGKVGKILLKI